MAEPLAASGFIELPYTVDTLVHRVRQYVRNIQVVGASFNVNTRATDSNDLDWADAAQGYWDALSYALDDAIAAPTAELWQYSGGIAVLQATAALTGGNGSGATVEYSLLVATFRGTTFKPHRVEVLEGNFTPPFTSRDYTAFGGGITNMLKQWTSAHTVTNPPYAWAVNKGNHYLNAGASFVKATASMSRSVRKRRGVL